MKRFDYVKYDEKAINHQSACKSICENLETVIGLIGAPSADLAKYLALNKLEEAYMWIGKAIRDDQLFRDAEAASQE